MEISREKKFIILGAGPAGMGAAWELVKQGATDVVVIDKNDRVGGLARTLEFKGYLFDVGPHRLLTKYPEVEAFWKEILGDRLLSRERRSHIYYRGRFFSYPLKITDSLWNLGFIQSFLAGLSFLKAQIDWYGQEPKNFADWTEKAFGRRMSKAFFQDYFIKVWGIDAHDVGIEWAGQRIKKVGPIAMLVEKFKEFVSVNKVEDIGGAFYYPRGGAGELYQKMQERLEKAGVQFFFDRHVIKVNHSGGRIMSVEARGPGGMEKYEADVFISSIPATHLFGFLSPETPKEARSLTSSMRFRAHIAVNMIVKRPDIFSDSWFYVQSPEYHISRIDTYKVFSPDMLARQDYSSIGIEFYCDAGDDFWRKSDDELIQLALNEMVGLGFMQKDEFDSAFVVRHEDAYPVYYLGYKEGFSRLREYLEAYKNLRLIGRAGMYKYKDQDHALYSGFLTVRNLFGERHDVWELGEEQEFYEEKAVSQSPKK